MYHPHFHSQIGHAQRHVRHDLRRPGADSRRARPIGGEVIPADLAVSQESRWC